VAHDQQRIEKPKRDGRHHEQIHRRNTIRMIKGQCASCRVDTEKAAELMAKGPWDAALLEELSALMRDASICGLGQAAPNPLLCVLKYLPDELAKPLGHW
jgi:NADH:ubiquinone oxidoreductase subunit F (NADH-binding)